MDDEGREVEMFSGQDIINGAQEAADKGSAYVRPGKQYKVMLRTECGRHLIDSPVYTYHRFDFYNDAKAACQEWFASDFPELACNWHDVFMICEA